VGIFDEMAKLGHEQLIFCHDHPSKLKALIAIHDTTLGPALGGCRMWPYQKEEEAWIDALRLARGMTYKSGVSGCDYGGGKSVIWADPAKDKSEELFRALGLYIEALNGRFITGTDVGTKSADFVWSLAETDNIVAAPEEYGGSGDSSIITAFGVWKGIKAAVKEGFGSDTLQGRRVALQGLGKVGSRLAKYLADDGAELIVCDTNPGYVTEVQAKVQVRTVKPEEIYDVPADVFSPNALGAVINDSTIPRLKVKVVAGAANNQLDEPRHGRVLWEKGIVYAPDYVINAGGLIQVADELMGFNRERAYRKAAAIYDALERIFAVSREKRIPSAEAADLLVEEKIRQRGQLKAMWLPR
jgi:leucine dehydrogenase